ncbi:hypothetical protein CPB86DRAFT_873231 [Serendipita vermifera]|nr:hypothetical protein CPB86DRAFT_873231 [Serendipita vermifera]
MSYNSSDKDYDEHVELLQKIYSLESNVLRDPTSCKALRAVKSKYNAVIEANTRIFQYKDLFQYLPMEIWLQILLEVVDDDCLNILPLMQVCQHWASIIVATGRLWTFIHIRGDLDVLELAHSALFLSKGLPLHMTIEVPIALGVEEIMLQRDSHRIQHLKIKAAPGHFLTRGVQFGDQLVNIVSDLLKGLGTLSSLESLVVDIESISHLVMFPVLRCLDAPNIKYLAPAFLPEEALTNSRYAHLRSMRTFSSLETVIPELAKLTDLEELVISGLGREELGSPPISYTAACKNIAPIRCLRSSRGNSDYIWPLLNQVRSSIRILELTVKWSQTFKLFTAIQEAPYLQEVRLVVRVDSSKKLPKTIQWKAPPVPQIQEFDMEISYPYLEEEDTADSFLAEASRILLGALGDSLIRTRALRLRSDIFASELVRFIKPMKHLNILNLDGSVQNDQAGAISCPSLRTLVAEDQRVLGYMRMPNLTSLRIRHRSESTIKGGNSADFQLDRCFVANIRSLSLDTTLADVVIVDGNEFTQLLVLKLVNRYAGYCYPYGSFPSLTKVSFSGSRAPLGVNYFCELLLRYPKHCPNLETICIYGYPEWDMLLYMLLRRNVYHSWDNISRITSIELPGYPASWILAPLSALLLGKFPLAIPPPEELSFVDILFNPTVPGCVDCVTCRLSCRAPFISSGSEEFPLLFEWALERSKASMPEGSDPPLAEHLQVWVDSWRERRRAWRQKQYEWKYYGNRRKYCARHNYSRLVIINGYTLDGIDIDSKEIECLTSQGSSSVLMTI